MAQFARFIDYVTGKLSKEDLARMAGVSRSTITRQLDWCFTVPTPPLSGTGEIYDQLFIDGMEIRDEWLLLQGVNNSGHVVAWQWATSENAAAYRALLEPLAPPVLVTSDGASGGQKALKSLWGLRKIRHDKDLLDRAGQDREEKKCDPGQGDCNYVGQPALQRCLIHIHRNNIRDLTQRPKTDAGRALLHLSKDLVKVRNKEDARTWVRELGAFYQLYEPWIKERTYAKDDPQEAATRQKTWWYTHERDRRVYHRLNRLYQEGTLFAFLEVQPFSPTPLSPFTNWAESINSGIRRLLDHHRGLSTTHAIAASEWFLYYHSENPLPPQTIYKNWVQNKRPTRRTIPRKPNPHAPRIGPAQWGTHLTPEEGLWTRKGWAGHSH